MKEGIKIIIALSFILASFYLGNNFCVEKCKTDYEEIRTNVSEIKNENQILRKRIVVLNDSIMLIKRLIMKNDSVQY